MGEAVGFGGDDEERTLGVAEEVDENLIARLGWDITIHEADGEGEGVALGEVRLDEGRPLGGYGSGDFSVAIAGQVGKDKGWARLDFIACALVQREEVDGASSAGRGGGMRLL